jgi:hypothetical protein
MQGSTGLESVSIDRMNGGLAPTSGRTLVIWRSSWPCLRMVKKRKPPVSRNIIARRWTLGLLLAVAGLAGGALLGAIVVGGGLRGKGDAPASFADLSANPAALAADGSSPQPACLDCADSYGVGLQLRTERGSRMDEPFRRLGQVDIDAAPIDTADDGYRYGGRFPDPEPMAMIPPVAVVPPPQASPTEPDAPPPPQTALGKAEAAAQ